MTSEQQVKAILQETRDLDQKKAAIYEQLMGELEPKGIRLINFNKLSAEEGKLLETYFDNEIAPYLSANIVSKQQPFPFLKNKDIYAVALLETKGGKTRTAIIPCSNNVFRRLIDIPTRKGTFMLSEELILHFLPKMFKNYIVKEKSLIRVTRNADIDTETIYDEDLDYRDAMENLIKQRIRMNPVRMELSRALNKKLIRALCKTLQVGEDHVFLTRVPLDMSFVFGIQSYLRSTGQEELFYPKRSPRMTPELDDRNPLIPQILQKDVLLSYPFESIRPFITLLYEAAKDDSVVSIKMTLYRLADKSKIVDALVEAAENGKEVLVLVELKARFDEENNIGWSRLLEDAGCRVIYGLDGYKVHSKLCLITKKTDEQIEYYTQIGTGNYNEKTSRLYTDLSLMTYNVDIGLEAANVFQALAMGETIKHVDHLLVAPKCLQNKILDMIDEEIAHARAGEPAYIGLKMNSLTDKKIMEKLVEASCAGVRIDMVIRGICCLRVGIPGVSENIHVRSIVGNFLEHSRIFYFKNGESDEIYMGSADWMPRNLDRRVEIVFPVEDERIKDEIKHVLDLEFRDNVKAHILQPDGTYEKQDKRGKLLINSQMEFCREATEKAEALKKKEKHENSRVFIPAEPAEDVEE